MREVERIADQHHAGQIAVVKRALGLENAPPVPLNQPA